MSTARKIAVGAVPVFVALVALVWFRWVLPLQNAVDIGSAMLAKQVCSCVYVAGREVATCRQDLTAETDPIKLEVLADENRVRAWIPGLGNRSAIYRDGFGCTLE